MTQAASVDAIVVGGGAIGLAATLALRAQGWRTVLLEQRQPQLNSTNPERAIALSQGSCRLLNKLGVWDEIHAHGSGAIRHIMVCESKVRGTTRLDEQELHVDALGHVVEMGHIIAPMWQRVHAQGDVYCPARINEIHTHETSLSIGANTAQGKQHWQTSCLFAADGTHSQVRRMLGIPTRGWPHNRFAIVASVRFEQAHNDTAWECFRSSGPLALLPMADQRLSLVWAVDASKAASLLSMDEQNFARALVQTLQHTAAARLGSIVEISQRGSFPLSLQLAKRIVQGRTLLLGNAAHSIHPVAGQGMNLGFRDVADLWEMLPTSPDFDSTVWLSHYAECRQRDIAKVTAFTEGLLAATASSHPLCKGLRSFAMRTLNPPSAIKQLLLQHAAGVRS